MDQSVILDPLLTTADVAKIYRVAERTIERWRVAGIGPVFIELENGGIRYSPADVAEHIRSKANRGEAVGQ